MELWAREYLTKTAGPFNALAGTALGAASGAFLGDQHGHTGDTLTGALAGGAIGGGIGALTQDSISRAPQIERDPITGHLILTGRNGERAELPIKTSAYPGQDEERPRGGLSRALLPLAGVAAGAGLGYLGYQHFHGDHSDGHGPFHSYGGEYAHTGDHTRTVTPDQLDLEEARGANPDSYPSTLDEAAGMENNEYDLNNTHYPLGAPSPTNSNFDHESMIGPPPPVFHGGTLPTPPPGAGGFDSNPNWQSSMHKPNTTGLGPPTPPGTGSPIRLR